MLTEEVFNGLSLRYVAHMRRCTMHIDVVDVLRFQASIVEGCLHHEFSTESVGVRGCDMICICTHSLAYHLCINLCTTCLGMLKLLKNEATGTLSYHKA